MEQYWKRRRRLLWKKLDSYYHHPQIIIAQRLRGWWAARATILYYILLELGDGPFFGICGGKEYEKLNRRVKEYYTYYVIHARREPYSTLDYHTTISSAAALPYFVERKMVARLLRLLAFSAALTAQIPVPVNASSETRIQTAMSRGTFILSSPTVPSFTSRKRNACHDFQLLFQPEPSETTLPSTPSQSSSMQLAMSTSPNQSLQQQIIQGATLKLRQKEMTPSRRPGKGQKQQARETKSGSQFLYHIREGQRSGMKYLWNTHVIFESLDFIWDVSNSCSIKCMKQKSKK